MIVFIDKKAWGRDLKAGQGYGPGAAAPVQSIGDKLAAKVVAESQKLTAAQGKPKTVPKGKGKGKPVKGRGIGTSPASGLAIKGWRFGDQVLSIEKGDTPGHEFHGNQYTTGDYSAGDRVQTHPATDHWMRGDRYGTVDKVGSSKVHVKLDTSGKTVAFHPSNLIPTGDKASSFGGTDRPGMWKPESVTTGGYHSHTVTGATGKKYADVQHFHAGRAAGPNMHVSPDDVPGTHQQRIEHKDATMPAAMLGVMRKGWRFGDEVISIEKGDLPGHDFHGNQYEGGGGGGMEVRHESGRPVASKAPSMTSRDYRHLADGVARSPLDDKTKAEFAAHLASSLYKTNSRFDGARFAAAAKGTPNKPGDKPRSRDYRSGGGMTRQNFKLVADAIKTFPLKDENTRASLADHFAGHLGQTNPRFDRSKFTNAAITKYEVVQLIEKGDLPGHEFHGNQWSTFAGGIGSPNKFSYSKPDARGGQYHVNPIASNTGRHQGYSLTRSAGPHPSEGPGLWRTITPQGTEKNFNGHEPTFRSPQAAKSAAKLHESRMMSAGHGQSTADSALDSILGAGTAGGLRTLNALPTVQRVVSGGLSKPGAKWTPATGWTDKPIK